MGRRTQELTLYKTQAGAIHSFISKLFFIFDKVFFASCKQKHLKIMSAKHICDMISHSSYDCSWNFRNNFRFCFKSEYRTRTFHFLSGRTRNCNGTSQGSKYKNITKFYCLTGRIGYSSRRKRKWHRYHIRIYSKQYPE